MFEILRSPNARRASGAAAIALLFFAGCVDPNYDGEGNDFIIRGPIQDVGDNSIQILPLEVVEAEGKAEDWFHGDDPTRVHDNYKDEWCNQDEVGEVFDADGNPQLLADIQEGEWVELSGQIRESKTSCGKTPMWDHRPVFETATELRR